MSLLIRGYMSNDFHRNKYAYLVNYLNQNFSSYIKQWFPNVTSDWKTGDFQDTKGGKDGGSLSFNIREYYAKDFATGETARDIVNIYAKRNNLSWEEATKRLYEEYDYIFPEDLKFKKNIIYILLLLTKVKTF